MPGFTVSRAKGVSIGELSRRTGVKVETIRYYEKIRMLPPPPRSPNGRRVYGAGEARILAFIRRTRELGFSLDDVRALLHLSAPGTASCRDVRQIASQHLERIRANIDDLAKLEGLLAKTIARCSGNTVPDCPVLDILDARGP